MKYLIAIEAGDASHAFGVVVPDLPGCFSAGDTLEEAIGNAREAIELWLETTIEDGNDIPPPQAASEHYANPEFSGWSWAVVEDIGISPNAAYLISKRKRV
nr:type II toxin-antitoxin system HicB family antitoxin [uncultured Duganella sp.]